MRFTLLIAFLMIAMLCAAQVRVDGPIQMTGEEPDLRQVHGLPPNTTSNAVLTAETELTNAHKYATPDAAAIWQLNTPATWIAPIPGTHLLVKAPMSTSGTIQLMLNDHGPFELTAGNGAAIDAASIPEGTVLSVVFDGQVFQLMNGSNATRRSCPAGMVAVSDQYCIQVDRHSEMLELFDAMEHCGTAGLRLCTWGEFVAACNNAAALGVNQMPGGWEWTNQTANENNTGQMVGNTGCFQASTAQPIQLRWVRCCLTR